MNFPVDFHGMHCGAASNTASDTLYDPDDSHYTSSYPLALCRRLQHRLSETSQSSSSTSGSSTISPHLLQSPAVITTVSDVKMEDESSADESSDDSSDGESDGVESSDAASPRLSLPVPSPAPSSPISLRARDDTHPTALNQSPSSPPEPPFTPKTKPLAIARPSVPFVRRSERRTRPASQPVPRDISPPAYDDAASESDFIPEPWTPAKRARRTTSRSSTSARAPPTSVSSPPKKWPRRDGGKRRSQNQEAQKKYRDRKKAKSEATEAALKAEKAEKEALLDFVGVMRHLLDIPSPSGPKVKKMRAEFDRYDRQMISINDSSF